MSRTSNTSASKGGSLTASKWGRRETTLALTLSGACLVLSLALLPSHGAALPSTEPAGAEASAEKTVRLVPFAVRSACVGEAWGSESLACLRAITTAGGRSDILPSRIVVARADFTRPNEVR